MDFIISQILGFIALIIICIGYFVKKKSIFLIIQIAGNLFYAGSFLCLKVWTGGIITLISILRCIYFFICEKYNFKYTLHFIPIFFVAYITACILTWQSWLDIIPLCTSIMFTIALYIKNLGLMRYVLLVPNRLLCVYCILNQTYTSAILDFIEVIVIVIAICKFHFSNKKNLSEN